MWVSAEIARTSNGRPRRNLGHDAVIYSESNQGQLNRSVEKRKNTSWKYPQGIGKVSHSNGDLQH